MIAYIFFFNDTATTEIYTLSLHDALPIFAAEQAEQDRALQHRRDRRRQPYADLQLIAPDQEPRKQKRDRKSTRLNSSHANISYAVFCLKKKKTLSSWKFCLKTVSSYV